MNLQYRPLGGNECVGSLGAYGVRIEAASSEKFDPEDSRVQQAVWEALKLVEGAVKEAAISVNPKEQDRARQERAQLLILFPQPIYVETIPNGYCNEACCKHLPWFVVTTTRGRIKIGWRKRVINIDWSDSEVRATGEELFAKEQTTKGGRHVHAWSYEKAKEYITTILAWSPSNKESSAGSGTGS